MLEATSVTSFALIDLLFLLVIFPIHKGQD